MKIIIALFFILCSPTLLANAYIGGSYGYSAFSSDQTKQYHLSQKGPTYGGFFGVGKEFVGLEGYYQNLETTGKIKHDGGSYDYTTNSSALGAALRFSFNFFYARLGFGRYKLKQKLDIDDDSIRHAAEEIYHVQNGVNKSGVLIGLGLHRKLGQSVVTFIDFSRHQIAGVGHYDSISAGISFILPDRLFGFDKL
jgi:hypothetical protein